MDLLILNAEHKQCPSRSALLRVSSQKSLVTAEKYEDTCKPKADVYLGRLLLNFIFFLGF